MYNGDFLVKYEDLTCVLEVVSRSGFLLFICRYLSFGDAIRAIYIKGAFHRIRGYLSREASCDWLGAVFEKGNYLSSPPA
jgi:hypothetical protein